MALPNSFDQEIKAKKITGIQLRGWQLTANFTAQRTGIKKHGVILTAGLTCKLPCIRAQIELLSTFVHDYKMSTGGSSFPGKVVIDQCASISNRATLTKFTLAL